jgi:hypothetical protein
MRLCCNAEKNVDNINNETRDMKLFGYFLVLFIVGCTSSSTYIPDVQQLDRSRLPVPNLTVSISSLGSCTDSDDQSIQINSAAPITVLVHGCNGSAGRFRSLAQLYAFHGQQAICFKYDARDSLVDSAEQLAVSLDQLSNVTNNTSISILGHSMGGLIARKALEPDFEKYFKHKYQKLELITVSAPFAGIEAANHCSFRFLHWLSLGIVPGICWLVTGDNWYEITSSSDFIMYPKPLLPSVQKYLKIVTNEENTCRRENNDGKCIESDDIFELSEQYHPVVDSYSNVIGVQVDAGHVEIVGNRQVSPRKLLSILQEYGVLSPTPPDRQTALERLLAELY